MNALGIIDLFRATIGEENSEKKSGRSFCFTITPRKNNARTYSISCQSEVERKDWMEVLISSSKMRPSMIYHSKMNAPLKQGYLIKRGHFMKNWKKRWFILRKNIIYYYKSRAHEVKKKKNTNKKKNFLI